jgi:hypothetical protein
MSGRATVTYNGQTYFVVEVGADYVTLEATDAAGWIGMDDLIVVRREELPAYFENIGKGASGVQSEPIPIRQDPAVPKRAADPEGRNE